MRPERETRIYVISKRIKFSFTIYPSRFIYCHAGDYKFLKQTRILFRTFVHLHVLLEKHRPDIGIFLFVSIRRTAHRSRIVEAELSLNNTLEFAKNIVLKDRNTFFTHVLFLSHTLAINNNHTIKVTAIGIVLTFTTHVAKILQAAKGIIGFLQPHDSAFVLR